MCRWESRSVIAEFITMNSNCFVCVITMYQLMLNMFPGSQGPAGPAGPPGAPGRPGGGGGGGFSKLFLTIGLVIY